MDLIDRLGRDLNRNLLKLQNKRADEVNVLELLRLTIEVLGNESKRLSR